MTERKVKAGAKNNEASGQQQQAQATNATAPVMTKEREKSPSPDKKRPTRAQDQTGQRQLVQSTTATTTITKSHLSYSSSSHSSTRRNNNNNNNNNNNYPSKYHNSIQRSRVVKPVYQFYQMPFTSKRTKTIYELDGSQKYIFQRGGYFENLRCPPCILNNLSQTYKHRGIPWWDGVINYRNFADHYEGLHLELEHFFATIKPYTEDDVLRKATFYCISKSIKRSKNYDIDTVKYYGSYSSGTYLPVSDIDLVVYCNQNYNIAEVLYEIAGLLFADGIIEKNCSVIHSRIPLLKFYDSLTGFLINITVNTAHVMERADYIRENIKSNQHMIKLLYFLKYYLIFKGTKEVYLGGIGSYSVALMVIRYFQLQDTQDLIKKHEKDQRPTILGHLLIGFLRLFSDKQLILNHTISVRDGGSFIPTVPHCEPHYIFPKKNSVLRIEDHLEPWKNVSSGSFNSDVILEDFGNLSDILLNPDRYPHENQVSILGNAVAVVDSFVDYRQILGHIYKEWFPQYSNNKRTMYNVEKYDLFISQRNVFGKRYLDFDYKHLEDNTTEIILKDKHLVDQAVRFHSQKSFARSFNHHHY